MRPFLCILYLLFPAQAALAACTEGWTNQPPYYAYDPTSTPEEFYYIDGNVTSTGKKPVRERLTVGKIYDGKSETGHYKIIKKNTLVRALQPEKFSDGAELALVELGETGKTQSYLQDVVGVSPDPTENVFGGKGTKGFIPTTSLKASSKNDVLMVTKDTALLVADADMVRMTLKYGDGLSPVKSGTQYKALNCNGKISYVFSLSSLDKSRNGKSLVVDDPLCLEQQLLPSQSFQDVQRLLTFMSNKPKAPLEINEWGLARLPEDPAGTYEHFTGTDPDGSDNWGKPDTVCELMNIAADWNKDCKGKPACLLQIGDISFETPALLASKKDPLGHKQHSDGTCIDMRPFRKDGLREGVSLTRNPEDYNDKLTKKFVKFIEGKGATPIYFNDPAIGKVPGRTRNDCDLENPKNDEGKGTFMCDGHNDHVHYCLKKPFVKGC